MKLKTFIIGTLMLLSSSSGYQLLAQEKPPIRNNIKLLDEVYTTFFKGKLDCQEFPIVIQGGIADLCIMNEFVTMLDIIRYTNKKLPGMFTEFKKDKYNLKKAKRLCEHVINLKQLSDFSFMASDFILDDIAAWQSGGGSAFGVLYDKYSKKYEFNNSYEKEDVKKYLRSLPEQSLYQQYRREAQKLLPVINKIIVEAECE